MLFEFLDNMHLSLTLVVLLASDNFKIIHVA
jgi:hypothetical protein